MSALDERLPQWHHRERHARSDHHPRRADPRRPGHPPVQRRDLARLADGRRPPRRGYPRQTIGPAGTEAELPVVVDAEGTVVTVKFDPAVLAD